MALLSLFLTLMSSRSLAQFPPPGYINSPIQGTYLNNCDHAIYNPTDSALQANCRRNDGSLLTTSIYYNLCDPAKDVWNIDGFIGCIAKPGTWGGGSVIPDGSYRRTCYDIVVLNNNGDIQLQAVCTATYGGGGEGHAPAILHLNGCSLSSDIWNDYEILRCNPASHSKRKITAKTSK
jgi:hypothetical protein